MSLTAADGALLDAVRALRWPARRRAPAGLAGEHISRVLGGSAEFTEYRAYRQGDDPGRIDWKLLARSNRVFIQLSQERTVLPTTLVVDASASLAFPESTLEKWRYASLVTLGLAAAAHRGGDPVALAVATVEGPRRLPLRGRRGVVQDIARVLGGVTPAGSPSLASLLLSLRTTGRVAIVSDFLADAGPPEASALLHAAARLCAAGREVYAVHVVHSTEIDPPPRPALVMDPEQKDLRRPMTDDTRPRYLAAFAAWRADLARAWRRAGAVYTEVVTTEPPAHAVRRIVNQGAEGRPR
jgi:uncharacterized protein (DUF58 family)